MTIYSQYGARKVYVAFGFLTILYCTFGYADNDFFHYEALYEYIRSTNEARHMEPIYIWLVLNLPGGYLLWRLVIWGIATILAILTFRRLNLEPKVTCCIFVLFYLIVLSIMRGNLGISILFWGFSFWVRPIPKHRMFSLILGTMLIAISYFFHSSMFVSILALLVTPFKLRKWYVIVSLLLFPILVTYVAELIQLIIMSAENDQSFFDANSMTKAASYAGRESAQSNINGTIVRIIQYIPIVGSLIWVTKRIVFQKYEVPSYIYVFFVYWYAVTYVSFLFFFQETSNWLFIRFLMMSYLPMVIVLSWFYSHNMPTRWMKFFLYIALLYCMYRLSYSFYNRLF